MGSVRLPPLRICAARAASRRAVVLRAEESLLRGAPPAAGGGSPAERIDTAVEHVWGFAHQPGFQALLELVRASRSDDALREAMTARDPDAARIVFDAFAQIVGAEIAQRDDFERNVRLIGLTLYGVAVTEGLRSRAASRRVLEELKELARGLFETSP